jgi:chromosome segregation ATPase
MNIKFTRKVAIGLAAILVAGVCLIDAGAQRRRRKRKSSTPRITNPAIAQPSPSDTTNGNPESLTNNGDNQSGAIKPATNEDPDSMKRTIRDLSSQVDKLSEKIGQMEQSQRSLVDLERLSRSEQRAEGLRAQLTDVQAKEGQLQAHLEDLDYALQPANVERAVAGYGTTHPEDAREQRRKQLESEKARVKTQLDTLGQSRVRLEQAVAAADVEVDRLRQKLDAADTAAIQNAKTRAEAGEPSQPPQPYPSPTPSPTPYSRK